MWAISVFGKPLLQHQHHSLSGCKLYFPQVFTICMGFFLSSSLTSWIYSVLTLLRYFFFFYLQDKIFPTLHLWLVRLHFVLADVYTSGVFSAAFLSCSIMSSKIHHVQTDSFCYFRKIWYNPCLSIFLTYWLSRQIKLTTHEITDHGIIRLEKNFKNSKTINPAQPSPALNHVLHCHICTFLKYLLRWWLRHSPGQPLPWKCFQWSAFSKRQI